MFKLVIALISVILTVNSSYAAEGSKYMQFSLYGVNQNDQDFVVRGGSASEYDYQLGVGLGASFGYAFEEGLRVEGEFSARSNEIDEEGFSGAYYSYAFMANGFYDFNTNTKFQPYVGAGIGLVHVTDTDLEDQVLGYQAMVGVNYNMTEDSQLVFGYRYLSTEDAKFTTETNISDASYDVQNIEVGFRFKF